MVDAIGIIKEIYASDAGLCDILVRHGQCVAEKSLRIARQINRPDLDMTFIEEAALLHDIGIIEVKAPSLGCRGRFDYICHGVIGREMLDRAGLYRHGLVCERHVGVGLTEADIRENNFPLPRRDMRPVTVEETIIAYADTFFSKNPAASDRERTVAEVVAQLSRYGQKPVRRFCVWAGCFGEKQFFTEAEHFMENRPENLNRSI